jgi:peptidoglycan/xylan/chitin deacetylase (PgdA/CDA1 family)
MHFRVLLLLTLSVPALAQARTVAVTVDDLPCAGCAPELPSGDHVHGLVLKTNERLLAGLVRAHIPVTGFVVERSTKDSGPGGPAALKEWIDDGFDLGNHTYSHQEFNKLSVEQEEVEIVEGESSIKPLMQGAGRKLQFFRFPYNQTGDTQAKHDAIASFLEKRSYKVAACTIDNEDYVFNAAYVKIAGKGETALAARLRKEYLAYTASEIDYYAALEKQVLGYEPPAVMLLHDNLLNADTIDDVLALFRERNYRFVSLEEAEKDPAYRIPETHPTAYGIMWGYRWATERGVKVNGKLEKEPPDWVTHYGEAGAPAPPGVQ